jgi:tetratricopeptide (TPR) repeat protein
LEQYQEAQQVFEELIIKGYDTARLRINLARACEALNLLDAAKAHLSKAIVQEPDNPIAQMNLGVVCKELQQLEEADHHLHEALRLNPDYHTARWNLSHLYLLTRAYAQGLRLFDSRFEKADPVVVTVPTTAPAWDGSDPAGKRILVVTEQAYGDTLQFIRYLPLLTAMGATIHLFTEQRPLVPLLSTMDCLHSLTTAPTKPPACDWQVALLSLPQLLGTTWETIPARFPYLVAAAEKISYWRDKLAAEQRLKVGIAWQGRTKPDPRRSIATDQLLPLFDSKDVAFFSLQLEARGALPAEQLLDYTAELRDFSDTAALISCLDLVISIDSAVAHLAGALGRSLWVLLPYAPDWRWHLDCPDSPWYPTARLFRQPAPGAWLQVINDVTLALQQLPSRSSAATSDGTPAPACG